MTRACGRLVVLLCAAALAAGVCLPPGALAGEAIAEGDCAAELGEPAEGEGTEPGEPAETQPLTKIEKLELRYRDCPEGGIAFFGSSYLSNWTSAGESLEQRYGFDPAMLYNYGIGGSGIELWTSDEYLDLVASKKPSVVVVNGVNDLRYYPASPDGLTDVEAAEKSFTALESYVAGLRGRLPGVKIVLAGAVKTPHELVKENPGGTTCASWRRIDLYNGMLRSFAQADEDVSFVELECYLLSENRDRWGNARVRFYTNRAQLCDPSSLATVQTIRWLKQRGVKSCPYFKADLHHPSELAYTTIWVPNVGGLAVSLFQEAQENLINNDSTSLVTHL